MLVEKPYFHHALKVDQDICVGCSHCMKVCPTEAIRVWGGKAVINENRCVDCGECFRVCPVRAIYIDQDDFEDIFTYKHRVALFPSVLIGQFPDEIRTSLIYQVLKELGFNHVFEVEHGVEIVSDATSDFVNRNNGIKPFISSFCPAIVRLIQVKFPALVDNIVLVRPPSDVSAMYYKKKLMDQGVHEEEIGIFYITPCAAKIAAVKSPVGEETSDIAGVINIDFIYNKILQHLQNDPILREPLTHELSAKDILWSLTNGEAPYVEGRSLSIDGIQNAIDFLEKVENEELKGLDFIEIRACDESCAGGILNQSNRFLIAERLKNRSKYLEEINQNAEKNIEKYAGFLQENITLHHITPRSMHGLDANMLVAMDKMKKVKKLLQYLPGFDCGACGAPSCQALAEDIAKDEATLSHCVFMQRVMEKHHKLSPQNAIKIIEKVWGINRLNKDNSRSGAIDENSLK